MWFNSLLNKDFLLIVSFLRMQESPSGEVYWIPTFVGMTVFRTILLSIVDGILKSVNQRK